MASLLFMQGGLTTITSMMLKTGYIAAIRVNQKTFLTIYSSYGRPPRSRWAPKLLAPYSARPRARSSMAAHITTMPATFSMLSSET